MRSHLKVKVYSLSSEMTYIRRQEEKWKTRARWARQKQKDTAIAYAEVNFWSNHWHRYDLKIQARTAHLAYGFMRGVPYSAMENLCYGQLKGMSSSEPSWKEIESTVERFSKDEPESRDYMQKFAEWITEAKAWYEGNTARIKARDKERAALKAALAV